MDDLIKRLRLTDPKDKTASGILQEAADEIERLRAALEWIAEDDGGRAGDEARAALGKAKR